MHENPEAMKVLAQKESLGLSKFGGIKLGAKITGLVGHQTVQRAKEDQIFEMILNSWRGEEKSTCVKIWILLGKLTFFSDPTWWIIRHDQVNNVLFVNYDKL